MTSDMLLNGIELYVDGVKHNYKNIHLVLPNTAEEYLGGKSARVTVEFSDDGLAILSQDFKYTRDKKGVVTELHIGVYRYTNAELFSLGESRTLLELLECCVVNHA